MIYYVLTASHTVSAKAGEVHTAPLGTPPGRYQPPDTLLAFLDSLTIMPTN